jgi:hypothetical protein
VQAVEALTEGGVAHAGTGPAAAEDSDDQTGRPRARRGRSAGASATSDKPSEGGADEPSADTGEGAPDAVQSKSRRRGRRGGRRRSRANAEVSSTDASE